MLKRRTRTRTTLTLTLLNKLIVLPLHKAWERSHLEFASSVWCSYKTNYIEKIEVVQRKATNLIPGMKKMTRIKQG